MNYKFLFPIFFFLFLLLSCNNDCPDAEFQDIIIGTWEINNPIGLTIEDDTVVFKNNGTGIGTQNGSFFTSAPFGSSNEFTWVFNTETEILNVIYTNGVNEEYTLSYLDCNEVHLDFEIAVLTLRN